MSDDTRTIGTKITELSIGDEFDYWDGHRMVRCSFDKTWPGAEIKFWAVSSELPDGRVELKPDRTVLKVLKDTAAVEATQPAVKKSRWPFRRK